MENADYAARYDRPYPKRDGRRYARMAKQVVDARHVEDMAGFFGTVAGASDDGNFRAASGAIGYAHYPTSWLETNGSIAALAGADTDPDSLGDLLYLGGNGGVRIGSPTRVAPFVGVGVFGGVSTYEIVRLALEDDEEDPFFEPEPDPDSRESDFRLAGAVYPEIGLHIWLTDRVRLTGSAAYYMTTEGRHRDFWLFGFSIGRFTAANFVHNDFNHDAAINWAPPESMSPDHAFSADVRRLPEM